MKREFDASLLEKRNGVMTSYLPVITLGRGRGLGILPEAIVNNKFFAQLVETIPIQDRGFDSQAPCNCASIKAERLS
jgi:hypothetical protein